MSVHHWTHRLFQGLEAGDEVLEFGSVMADNFTTLQQIGQVVQHSIGVCLTFYVPSCPHPLAAFQMCNISTAVAGFV